LTWAAEDGDLVTQDRDLELRIDRRVLVRPKQAEHAAQEEI